MESGQDISSNAIDQTRTVFRQVWKDFYDWENAYSQGAITSLSQSSGRFRGSSGIASSIGQSGVDLTTRSVDPSHAPQESSQTQLTRWDYTSGSSTVSPTKITADVVSVLEFRPYLEYESVTPTTRSIFHGDDDSSMAFIPYPEDPAFDFFEHTYEYKTFAWQVKFHDPDSELVDKATLN